MYNLRLSDKTQRDIESLKKSGKKSIVKKITTLLIELSTIPTTGTGKPEQLKHELAGLWSRRINKEDRLIYEIDEKNKVVNVLSAKGHYNL